MIVEPRAVREEAAESQRRRPWRRGHAEVEILIDVTIEIDAPLLGKLNHGDCRDQLGDRAGTH